MEDAQTMTLEELFAKHGGRVTNLQLRKWAGGSPDTSLDDLLQLRTGRWEGWTLAQLIAARKGRETLKDLVTRVPDGPSRATWQNWAGRPMRGAPDRAFVPLMAQALRVPVADVWDAIGVSLGYDLQRTGQATPAILQRMGPVEELTREQEEILVAIAREFLKLENPELGATEEAPEEPTAKVRPLRAARKTTGHESRGPRGGTKLW